MKQMHRINFQHVHWVWEVTCVSRQGKCDLLESSWRTLLKNETATNSEAIMTSWGDWAQGKQNHFTKCVFKSPLKNTTKVIILGFSNKENFQSRWKWHSSVPSFIAEGRASMLWLRFLLSFIRFPVSCGTQRAAPKISVCASETFTGSYDQAWLFSKHFPNPCDKFKTTVSCPKTVLTQNERPEPCQVPSAAAGSAPQGAQRAPERLRPDGLRTRSGPVPPVPSELTVCTRAAPLPQRLPPGPGPPGALTLPRQRLRAGTAAAAGTEGWREGGKDGREAAALPTT